MLGIDFKSYKINVPELAAKAKKGLEEVAREERYKIFQDELCEKYSCIATAHNSTDNLETFIFNLMRGAGLSGLCGIPPIRDNIIRPILTLPKETILDFLNEAKIPFVTDQTNFSTEYTRNYIRHEIIPKLKSLSHSPEDACAKAIETLRQDNEYLVSAAVASLKNCRIEENLYDAYKLSILDFPILARALKLMIKDYGAPSPEKTHIDKIARLLKKGEKFEIYLPGRVSFFSDGKKCYIDSSEGQKSNEGFDIKLNYGINYIPELDIYILLTNEESENISSNVYKLSMQVNIKSAIICGDIGIRTKRDGDTYFYGGITRKVKKLFNDKKIPIEERNRIPVFYDESGIIWIPGFGVRDDGNKESTTHFLKIYKKG
jgi:tRNA(Ile)-lysidine synthase